MTIEELVSLFPEVPAVLRRDPFLEGFAQTFDEPLRQAARPSNCAGSTYAPGNLIYLKLIMPMDILNIGLGRPERVVAELTGHLQAYQADPAAWMAEVVPVGTPARPAGCEGG